MLLRSETLKLKLMSIEDFFARYSDRGYKFSDEILTRYALSLSTKPFVILSGISGTGKTKIAQLFEPVRPATNTHTHQTQGSGEIILKVTKGLAEGDRGNLQFSQLAHIFESNEVTQLEAKIADLLASDPDSNKNISEPIIMVIEAPNGNEAKLGVYLQRPQNPLVRIRLKSKASDDEQFDSTEFFKNNFQINDILKMQKSASHRFKVESVNDVQAVASSNSFEDRRISEIDRKCFISVKSNWTDSSELFGYFNPIAEKYIVTKLLKFIILAHENPDIPFFVILDEMNLSRVEHYFSDFLSCIESRTVDANGKIEQEPIHLYSGSQYVQTDDDEHDEIRSSIEIPLNLFITGTVNVDDTTYMFSPKVLDRANVIEFNDVYLDDIPEAGNFKLSSFPDFTSQTKSDIAMFAGLRAETKTHIKDLLDILKSSNMHFGYRTISEVSHFITNSNNNIDNSLENELTALDIQILQKILPKLHGNYAKLHDTLKELIYYLSKPEGRLENFSVSDIEAHDISTNPFSRSLKKLLRMYKTLSTQGFTSFID